MTVDATQPALDLLVVGALTIDRFADGTARPGGSALHMCRATAARGLRTGAVVTHGPEPAARAGLRELRRLAVTVEAVSGERTMVFRHEAGATGRTLHWESRGDRLRLDPAHLSRFGAPAAVLLAPVADELDASAVRSWDPAAVTVGAILQGWLRGFGSGGQVIPIPLAALDPALVDALAACTLIVASNEDLRAVASTPVQQLEAVRRRIGPAPSLVVTDGAQGSWVSHGGGGSAGEPVHVPVPRRVDGVDTTGAGDIFTAFMLARGDGDLIVPATLIDRARRAAGVVADVLAERAAGAG